MGFPSWFQIYLDGKGLGADMGPAAPCCPLVPTDWRTHFYFLTDDIILPFSWTFFNINNYLLETSGKKLATIVDDKA